MNKEIEILMTADEYLYKLKNGINVASTYMQEEKEKEAFSIIVEIIDGLGWITEVIRLTKDVVGLKIDLSELNEFLEEIVEALENEDFILVGDLFNYEILPILETIHTGIINILKCNLV